MSTFIRRLLLIALVAVAGCGVASAQSLPVPAPPDLSARSYILLDFHSGQQLVNVNAHERVEPASLTKVMTAYVVFSELQAGNITLDELVTISERAWRTPGSRMFVEVRSQVAVEDLLKGLIIQSGNDAAVALAEHIAGDEQTFAQFMNQHARQLGLTGTQYRNATGLPDPEHYTTAYDTALLTAAAIRNFPEYYTWYSERQFTWNGITQQNRNRLLWRDASVDGGKTGHTRSAGYCLMTSAQREGMRLIAVVMGADSEQARADHNLALLNYGFRFFETHRLFSANEPLTQARIWKGETDALPLGLTEDLYVTIPRRQYEQLEASMSVDGLITAPASAGNEFGRVKVQLGDEVLHEAPLIALNSVEPGGFWSRLVDDVLLLFQ